MLSKQFEQIIDFLQSNYGLNVKNTEPFLSGVQNSNFLIDSDQGSFVFRIYNRKTAKELNYTIQVLSRLENEDLPAPKLIKSNKQALVLRIESLPCLLYHYLPGRSVDVITEKALSQLGLLQGKLHQILRNERSLASGLDWDLPDLFEIVSQNKLLLETMFPESLSKINFIINELKRFSFSSDLPKGGTHQDLKPENVLIDGDGLICGIVDFDNGYYGTLLHDITTTIIWCCFENNNLNLKLLKCFLTNYEKIRVLSSLEKNNFYKAIKFRFLREAIIWYMYVGHNKERAVKMADYFLGLYTSFNISEQALTKALWTS